MALKGKMTSFSVLKLQLGTNCDGIVAIVQDGELFLYKVGSDKEKSVVQIFKYDVVSVGFAPLCLVKCLNSGSMNLLAASDFEGNIHILDLNQIPNKANDKLNPCFTLYSTHSKLISDMTFISMPLPE